MKCFEYQVIPAPKKGEKAKGAKTTSDRFALALTNLMNRMGAEGWEYVRADTLPCEERVGLTGSKTAFQNMLVFRRDKLVEAVEMIEHEIRQKTMPPLRREPILSPVPIKPAAEESPEDPETEASVPPMSRPIKIVAD
ncbi:MAG: DUF4177 domain-containing protein [Pseudorhodobacter sp.]